MTKKYYAPGGASALSRVKNGSVYLAKKLSITKVRREKIVRGAHEVAHHARRAYKLAQKTKKYGVTKKISRVARIGTKHLTRGPDPIFAGYTDYSGGGSILGNRQPTKRRVTRQGKPKKKRTVRNEIRDPFHFT